ncbi:GNAT family N-acetyltransferase [Cryobacterium sp. TMT1-19]|uniref:GNAT family N-acetyltransferase n=1 Tax=Cryobacterium sp. TMT1-19 TaxID=1259231 RepID=UPI00106BDBEF|nr:GNAT family N-acetyltransferase [Cryobacterium sp. TMT1-19]TFD35943.1 GNAT family N-acetyltransferase [Cryobacterium sp. TMT1-19]
MTLHIRDASTEDIDFLAAMLLEAVNWRQDRQTATLQSIMNTPDLWHYLSDWKRSSDFGFLAHEADKPVGAAWARFMTAEDPGYGFVDEDIPELGMGVVSTHRGQGVGRVLLERTIRASADRGLRGLSLSVEDENERARALYVSNGFVVAGRAGNSDTMVLRF